MSVSHCSLRLKYSHGGLAKWGNGAGVTKTEHLWQNIQCNPMLIPLPSSFFFFFWLLGQLDEGRTELLDYSLRHPMSSRSKTKFCLARFLARAPSRWLLGMPKPSRLFLSQSEPTRGVCFREVICVTSARPIKFLSTDRPYYIFMASSSYIQEKRTESGTRSISSARADKCPTNSHQYHNP